MVASQPTYEIFEEKFWKLYPKRDGSNPKAPAAKKYLALMRSGEDPEAIERGLRSYADKLKSTGQVGTPFVMQAITWLNRRCWEDYAQQNLPLLTLVNGKPLTKEQQEDYKSGWRPGMPSSAEILGKAKNGA
jgi:hypothetical protein